jgi:hypothetical protein
LEDEKETHAMADSHELSAEDCERLLRGGIVGRVGFGTLTAQHIVMVNYSVVDDRVVFRTDPNSVLGRHAKGTHLAFEIDHVDHADQRGWSVVAKGVGSVITDPHELDRIRRQWPPRPWATGDRGLVVGLRWTELSGRRLGEGWRDRDVPVRRVLAAEPRQSG